MSTITATEIEARRLTATDPNYNWGAEEWRAPKLQDGDMILYSECGRILNRIDYRSHYFRIVARGHKAWLLISHGGGEEEFQLDYDAKRVQLIFDPLDSDARYLLAHMLFNVWSDARRAASKETARTYKAAFVNGQLKKRKLRGQDAVKVWIQTIPDNA